MKNISKIVLFISDRCKPILVRILPISLLLFIKRKIIKGSYKRLDQLKIKPYDRVKYKDGINLIGNIRAEIGLGQSCRLIANELNKSLLEFIILNYVQDSSLAMNDHTWDHKLNKKAVYNINIIHINSYEMGVAYLQIDKSTWDYRYNIAFWLWELESFPDEWTECISYLDEIWTPSEFTSRSIRKKTHKPVYTIPYFVTTPVREKFDRAYFKLPQNKFLYLIMYDSNSTIERKNPLGAIEAYKKAFPIEKEEVGLVIKVNNIQKKDVDSIKKILRGYQNIYFISETLEKEQVNSLIKCMDVFISLHRAEGFGLVLAESMLLGTPTIATNWSSNIEFMTKDTSCLVDYELVEIEKEYGPYKLGNRWAEPNNEIAAMFILRLYEDEAFYHRISESAKSHVRECLNLNKIVKLIEDRVGDILKDNY